MTSLNEYVVRFAARRAESYKAGGVPTSIEVTAEEYAEIDVLLGHPPFVDAYSGRILVLGLPLEVTDA